MSELSAEELRIDPSYHAALVKTLLLMEAGAIRHEPLRDEFYPLGDQSDDFTGHFNMGAWNASCECGTVACIGGTAEIVGNVRFDHWTTELDDLFYPTCSRDYKEILLSEATRALRNYLTTGDAKWSQVLGEAV